MKIAFLIRSLDYGGQEGQLLALSRGLQKLGHRVVVLLFYGGGPIQTELEKAGVTVLPLGKAGRWDLVKFTAHLVGTLRRERPDVLHSYLVEPNLAATLVRPFLPWLPVVWGLGAAFMDLARYGWFPRATFQIQRLLSRLPDLIIVNSRAGFEHHARYGFPRDKMVLIPNGADTERFRPDREAGLRVRAEWGVRADHRVIGLVARLDPIKDHPTFLRAAALLAREYPGVRFVCVGDGADGYRAELHALASALDLAGRVIWAGARGDMPAVYNAFDLATSSSYGEGLSNAICEAMACGIPCVVTNVGDSALVVGDTGIVVPPRDPGSLASGWARALGWSDETRRRTGRKARDRIVAEYGEDLLAARTAEALKALL